jgi:hypothetical protein
LQNGSPDAIQIRSFLSLAERRRWFMPASLWAPRTTSPKPGKTTVYSTNVSTLVGFSPSLRSAPTVLPYPRNLPYRPDGNGGKAQFCWAHLKRNLLGIVEFTRSSAVERFYRDALAQPARLYRLWHRFRNGQIDRSQLLLRSIPIQKRIFAAGRTVLGQLSPRGSQPRHGSFQA